MALTQIEHVSTNDHMAECIDNCFEAVQASEWCASACIELGDAEMTRCIELCRDVADVADLHARFMARNSEFEPALARICAELCSACADECGRFEHDHCQTCADVLQDCARSCNEMAAT